MQVSPTLMMFGLCLTATALAVGTARHAFQVSENPRLLRALVEGGAAFAIYMLLFGTVARIWADLDGVTLLALVWVGFLVQFGASVFVHFAMLKAAWARSTEPPTLSSFPKAGWTGIAKVFLVAAIVLVVPAFFFPELFALVVLCLGVALVLAVLQACNWARRMIDLAVVLRWQRQVGVYSHLASSLPPL